MEKIHRGIYHQFPMQAALGLYSLQRFSEEGKKEKRKKEHDRKGDKTCTSEKTTSAATSDTKP